MKAVEVGGLILGVELLSIAALPVHAVRASPTATVASRCRIRGAPGTMGSLSIGRPDAGALLGAVPVPKGRLWLVRDRWTAWATRETVHFLTMAIWLVEERHPGSPPVVIGDLSHQHGGPIGRHRSHQSGRDADVGWYVTPPTASAARRGTISHLDLTRCWALVRALVTATDVERIFIDRAIQRALLQQALDLGEDRAWLEDIFESAGRRRRALIQHEPGHRTHLHVRFLNRQAQEWGRRTCCAGRLTERRGQGRRGHGWRRHAGGS